MDFDQLQIFVKAANCGSLSRAAVELEQSLSSLSKRLAALEEDLGTRLFYRTGRGLTLTDAGKVFLPGATAMLLQASTLRASVRDAGSVPSGEVRFGLLPSLSGSIVGPLFNEVQRNWAGVKLSVLEGFSDALEAALANGRLDFALCNRYGSVDRKSEDLIQTVDTYLVGRKDAALTNAPTIDFRRLDGCALVLPNRGHGLRPQLDLMAKNANVNVMPILEVDSFSAMMDAVVKARVYTLLPKHTVTASNIASELRISRVVRPTIRRHVVLRLSATRPFTPAVKVVVATARRLCTELLIRAGS